MSNCELPPDTALALTLKWARHGSGPSLDTVLAVSSAAFPCLWQVWPYEDSLVILGELRRYALSTEPESDSDEPWRTDLRRDGLEHFFWGTRPDGGTDAGEFTFHFSGHGMKHRFLEMVEANVPFEASGAPSIPLPDTSPKPHRCIAQLASASDAYYGALTKLVVHKGELDDAVSVMDEAYGRICSATIDLQAMLALAHEPVTVGYFVQAIHDSFLTPDLVKEGIEAADGASWTFRPGGGVPAWDDGIWDARELGRVGIPYFRRAFRLMSSCYPYADFESEVYAPASLAAALTGLSLVEINRLSAPDGPVRCKRPSRNRRYVHLGDIAKHIKSQNPHI